MCGFVRALLFIYILFICVDSAPYFLDPPFPPLAYVGQNYELKFNVRGLPQLAFTFQGLPYFFTGSKDGSIKGAPIETGSYKIIVTYTSKNTTGSQQVIFSIATNQTNLDSDIVLKMNTLQIESSASSWIYYEGQAIQIEFWCSDAQEPSVISYRNLPKGITADLSLIKGSIMTSGLYTFSVFLGDSLGNQAQTYYTLNIQPKNSLSRQSSNKIADVSVFSQGSNINLSKVDSDQIKTRNKVQSLYDKLQSILNSYNMAKNTQAISYNNMLLAQQQSFTFDQSFTSAQSNYNKILSFIKEATTVIQNLKMQVSQGEKLSKLSITQVLKAQQIYNYTLSVSQNFTESFNYTSKLYADVQRQLSQLRRQVNLKQADSISARNNYTLAVNNQEKARIDLDNAKSQSSFASDQANRGQIFRELSMQDRDSAENNLKSIDNSVKDAKNQLKSINLDLDKTRFDFENARRQLGIAKFNLTIAQNALFVAQAAKQAADKSLAILVAQGNGNAQKQNYKFAGCIQNGRPILFGTAKILKIGANSIKTSAGHILIWGDCTKKEFLTIGSYIYYEGFIAQDSISVKLIKKVTL